MNRQIQPNRPPRRRRSHQAKQRPRHQWEYGIWPTTTAHAWPIGRPPDESRRSFAFSLQRLCFFKVSNLGLAPACRSRLTFGTKPTLAELRADAGLPIIFLSRNIKYPFPGFHADIAFDVAGRRRCGYRREQVARGMPPAAPTASAAIQGPGADTNPDRLRGR